MNNFVYKTFREEIISYQMICTLSIVLQTFSQLSYILMVLITIIEMENREHRLKPTQIQTCDL